VIWAYDTTTSTGQVVWTSGAPSEVAGGMYPWLIGAYLIRWEGGTPGGTGDWVYGSIFGSGSSPGYIMAATF
jgi:hypothetical protein